MVNYTLIKTLSEMFNIPATYFIFPNIIFYFIIPFISITYFWYIILNRKIRIFRRKNIVNFTLAFIISFFNIAAIPIVPPWISVPIFVGFATLLSGRRWSFKRILISSLLAIFIGFLYFRLMTLTV